MPRHHEWLANIESETTNLTEVTSRLQSILSGLEGGGTVSLVSSGLSHTVAPKGNINYVIRYERHHSHKLSLKLEMTWDERGDGSTSDDFEVRIT